MKKLGFILMALVLSLGVLGVGYAGWTDNIFINGTVNTGNVELELYEFSDTIVYKDLANDEIVVQHVRKNQGWPSPGPLNWSVILDPPTQQTFYEVASAVTTAGNGNPADVVMTWTNIFPEVDFTCDLVYHYNGSVPVKARINYGFLSGDEELLPYISAHMELIGAENPDDPRIGETVDEGYQLHYCDVVKLEVTINLPQDNSLQNLSASGWANIDVIQWNEYGMPGAPLPFQPLPIFELN
ncbi:hypothetical protein ACFLTP_03530 [Chloroflexota bacterium]